MASTRITSRGVSLGARCLSIIGVADGHQRAIHGRCTVAAALNGEESMTPAAEASSGPWAPLRLRHRYRAAGPSIRGVLSADGTGGRRRGLPDRSVRPSGPAGAWGRRELALSGPSDDAGAPRRSARPRSGAVRRERATAGWIRRGVHGSQRRRKDDSCGSSCARGRQLRCDYVLAFERVEDEVIADPDPALLNLRKSTASVLNGRERARLRVELPSRVRRLDLCAHLARRPPVFAREAPADAPPHARAEVVLRHVGRSPL
jgi:hypothetical protein